MTPDLGNPGNPRMSSKNADLAAIRVTSELATSSDAFVLCAGCGLGEGRGAPVQAPAPPKPLSTEKHICFGALFFVFLPVGAKRIVFTMKYALRDDRVFDILAPKWRTVQDRPEETLGGLGRAWGGSGGALGELWEALYIEKLPINRPQRTLCLIPLLC